MLPSHCANAQSQPPPKSCGFAFVHTSNAPSRIILRAANIPHPAKVEILLHHLAAAKIGQHVPLWSFGEIAIQQA